VLGGGGGCSVRRGGMSGPDRRMSGVSASRGGMSGSEIR
jgi:hypothetical protein